MVSEKSENRSAEWTVLLVVPDGGCRHDNKGIGIEDPTDHPKASKRKGRIQGNKSDVELN